MLDLEKNMQTTSNINSTLSPSIPLTWRGQETIEEVQKLINQPHQFAQIEIALPVDYNHALFSKLKPTAPPAQPETLNVLGGPELLNKVAMIHGLEIFEKLIKPLSEINAQVRIISPPHIIIMRKVKE